MSVVEVSPPEKPMSDHIEETGSVKQEPVGSVSPAERVPVKWYRSTWYNAVVLGMCNFCAPGTWGAMNALGGGGEESPWLVDSANALTFCLMVVTCSTAGVFVKYIGIRYTLILGAAGFCPYAAGLYCNNRFGSSWFVLVGAAFCGLGSGLFWMAEAAIALAYPETYNQGRFLGLWLAFRIAGQIMGGSVNLGLNANRDYTGSASYSIYQVFIAIQALAPFIGFLLTPPEKAERTDGVKVSCSVPKEMTVKGELLATWKLFITKRFLLILPLIAGAVFSEAVFFTFQGLWFTVRARSLASLLSGVIALLAGNILGYFLDHKKLSDVTKGRWAFIILMVLQGAWWTWGAVIVTRYHKDRPYFDWDTPGFASGFTWFLVMVMGFQVNYMYLYFVVGNLSQDEAEIVRFAGLLRATQSASQAVSYGLCSVKIMGEVGALYLNFGLWAVAIPPAWLVIKEIGRKYSKRQRDYQ